MTIIEKKTHVTVKWSKAKEADLTWRKVRKYCDEQIEKLDNSNEAHEVEVYKIIISMLQAKIEKFEKKKIKYMRMRNAIKLTDADIDTPFGEKQD